MNARWQLFAHKDPYDLTKTSSAFMRATYENIDFHQKNCEPYKVILETKKFNLESLVNENDLHKIPVLPTLFFKRNHIFSMDEADLKVRANSSGTKGVHSVVGFDGDSLKHGVIMMFRFFAHHKVISPVPTNYIILSYEPSTHSEVGAIKTAYGATKFAPALKRVYALKDTGTDYVLNQTGIERAIFRFSKMPFPVRFVGFPAYLYLLTKTLSDQGIKLQMPKGSKVLLGGGWKQFSSEAIDPEGLFKMVESTLGIKRENCLEFYSAVEHPIPYFKCNRGHFHVPIYSRVIIRDVETLEPLPYGQLGLLSFVTPLVMSMPLTSVVTDDLAIGHDGGCECGIRSPYFKLFGRAGVSQIKTCTADAAELMGGKTS